MLIENPEALKTWLTAYLEPLCDADPAALSKYVLALIKKDKPQDELKKSMQAQMEVFLQQETQEFIQVLFETLDSKDYVNGPPTKPTVKSEVVEAATAEVEGGEADSTTPIRNAEGDADVGYHQERRRRSGGDVERDFRGRPRRSPPRRRPGRYRSRSPPPGHFRGRSRSRSRSPYRRARPFGRRSRSRSYSPPPHARHRSRSPPLLEKDDDPYRAPPPPPVQPGKRVPRCRDYDEKGFCMRGDQCKFDHGNDAVVLEDTAVPPPGVPGAGPAVPPYQPAGGAVYADPYVPGPAAALPVQMPPLHLPPPGYANPRKRGMDDAEAYPPAKQSVYDRLGAYGRGRGRGRGRGGRGGRGGAGSSQIAVRNIPPTMNNIAHLNNHFARFGTLVNVQVQFEGDPASALVSFSNPSEAGAAFNTPEAVLGNRFIKMHFHYDRPVQQSHHGHQNPFNLKKTNVVKPPVTDESKHGVKEEVNADGETITKTITNEQASPDNSAEKQWKAEERAAALAAIKKNQEMLEMKTQLKKEQEEKRKENLKKAAEIQKSKQDLLEKLIDEQKKIITKLEEKKATIKADEKATLMTLLKSLAGSIEKAKEDVKQAMALTAGKRDLQKELLDAELELFQAQQDGSEEAVELQKKVNLLRLEAARTGKLPTSLSPRGGRGGFRGARGVPRGSYFNPRFRGGRGRGRGRGFAPTTSFDRRPSKILVAGFEEENKDSVLEHFKKFGEILDIHDGEDDGLSTIIHYKSRREAELAMNGGKNYGEAALQLSWFTGVIPSDSYHSELSSQISNDSLSLSGLEEPTEAPTEELGTYLPDLNADEDKEKAKGVSVKEEIKQEAGGDNEEEEDPEAVTAQVTEEEADQLLYDDDETEEDDERSWKR